MPNQISQIQVGGVTYDICDATASRISDVTQLGDRVESIENNFSSLNDFYSSLGITPPGTILWSGTYYMTADHIANLSHPISSCLTGIVLHWQPYTSPSGTSTKIVQDYFHNLCFVPKYFTAVAENPLTTFILSNLKCAQIAFKNIRIADNYLEGNDGNSDNAKSNATGITYQNGYFVLTEVIAV